MSEHEKTLRDWLALYAKHGTLMAEPITCLDALLAEHAKALIRARNEGLEKAAKQADMMEFAAIQVAIGSMAAPVAAGEAQVMGRAARQVANAIRALKDPES